MRVVTIVILICFIVGCKNEDGLPAGILKRDKMQAVFLDVVQAESFTAQNVKRDSTKNGLVEDAKLQQKIFAVHKITKEEFYSSYSYYATHTELMRSLLDSITAKGEREKYAVLYAKPLKPMPVRISLIPLPVATLPKLIPMPIPSVEQQIIITPPAASIVPLPAPTIVPSPLINVKPIIPQKPFLKPVKQKPQQPIL